MQMRVRRLVVPTTTSLVSLPRVVLLHMHTNLVLLTSADPQSSLRNALAQDSGAAFRPAWPTPCSLQLAACTLHHPDIARGVLFLDPSPRSLPPCFPHPHATSTTPFLVTTLPWLMLSGACRDRRTAGIRRVRGQPRVHEIGWIDFPSTTGLFTLHQVSASKFGTLASAFTLTTRQHA